MGLDHFTGKPQITRWYKIFYIWFFENQHCYIFKNVLVRVRFFLAVEDVSKSIIHIDDVLAQYEQLQSSPEQKQWSKDVEKHINELEKNESNKIV